MNFQLATATFRRKDLPYRSSEALKDLLSNNLNVLQDIKNSSPPGVIEFVTALISVFDSSRYPPHKRVVADRWVPKIVASDDFFPNVFHEISLNDSKAASKLLHLVYESLFSVIPSNSKLVTEFMLKVVSPTQFFKDFDCIALGRLVAIQFLDVKINTGDSSTYLFDPASVSTVHKVVRELANPELLLVWGLILFRLAHADPPAKTLNALHVDNSEDLILLSRDLLSQAIDNDALKAIVKVYIDSDPGIHFAQTISDVLQELLSVVQMSNTLADAIALVLGDHPLLAQTFWNERTLHVLTLTKMKLPASLKTYLSLCRSVPDPYPWLETLSSFVEFVNPEDLLQGPDDSVEMANDTTVFPARASDNRGGVTLPKGSTGTLVNSNTAYGSLVMWNIEYNGWAMIGRVIENAILSKVWDSTAISSFYLVIATLRVLPKNKLDSYLAMLSAALERGDFLQMISLHLESLLGFDYANVDTVGLMLKFYTALAKLWPEKVWEILKVSNLLESHGRGGYIFDVVGAVEVFRKDYSFTLVIIDMVKVIAKNPKDERVMCQLTGFLLDVFESFVYWTYANIDQRKQILEGIMTVFTLIIKNSKGESRNLVLNELLNENKQRTVKPLFTVLETEDEKAIGSTLDFCTLLVNSRSENCRSYSQLEKDVYSSSPKLVTLYGSSPNLQISVIRLFEALVGAKGQTQPSLLAYLGIQKSEELLKNLNGTMDNDLVSDETVISVCSFFTAVKASKQQGLLVLLMNGNDGCPSLFYKFQKKVTKHLDLLSSEVAGAILNAVAESPQFAPKMVPVLQNLVVEGYDIAFDSSIATAYYIYSVAKAIDILANFYMEAHDSPEMKKFMEFLEADGRLQKFSKKFLNIVGHDYDLHGQLRMIINEDPHCIKVANPFASTEYPKYSEESFVYACADPSSEPFIKPANVNLSFVHSQITLINAWTKLCTAVTDKANADRLENIALLSLQANTNQELATTLYEGIIENRVGLCFYILHQLKQRKKLKNVEPILLVSLTLIDSRFIGMKACAVDGSKPQFYKLLLKILNVCFESPEQFSDKVIRHVLEVVVVEQIPGIVAVSRTNPTSAAEDLTQIIILLKQSLDAKPSAETLRGVYALLTDSRLLETVAKLYASKLDHEMQSLALAELSMLFILEWLPVGQMCWYFVSSGLMHVIIDAPLSGYIQKGGVVATVSRRIHAVWTKGLLMMILTILDKLGPQAVTAGQLFVEHFRPQITTCFEQWTKKTGKINLALVEETSLITAVLILLEANLCGELKGFSQEELLQALDHLSSHRKYLSARMSEGEPTSEEDLDRMIIEMADLRQLVGKRSKFV